MTEIRYRLTALADLAQIYAHINADNPHAAREVIGRIKASIERLALFPRSGRAGAASDTYELIAPSLPYIVVYQFDQTLVDIVAIFHTSRDR